MDFSTERPSAVSSRSVSKDEDEQRTSVQSDTPFVTRYISSPPPRKNTDSTNDQYLPSISSDTPSFRIHKSSPPPRKDTDSSIFTYLPSISSDTPSFRIHKSSPPPRRLTHSYTYSNDQHLPSVSSETPSFKIHKSSPPPRRLTHSYTYTNDQHLPSISSETPSPPPRRLKRSSTYTNEFEANRHLSVTSDALELRKSSPPPRRDSSIYSNEFEPNRHLSVTSDALELRKSSPPPRRDSSIYSNEFEPNRHLSVTSDVLELLIRKSSPPPRRLTRSCTYSNDQHLPSVSSETPSFKIHKSSPPPKRLKRSSTYTNEFEANRHLSVTSDALELLIRKSSPPPRKDTTSSTLTDEERRRFSVASDTISLFCKKRSDSKINELEDQQSQETSIMGDTELILQHKTSSRTNSPSLTKKFSKKVSIATDAPSIIVCRSSFTKRPDQEKLSTLSDSSTLTVPSQVFLHEGMRPPGPITSQRRHFRKKKIRRSLSEILRAEGLNIGEPSKKGQEIQDGLDADISPIKSHFSWYKYSHPRIQHVELKSSSLRSVSTVSLYSVQEAPQEEPKISGINLFRKAVNIAMNQLVWNSSLQRYGEQCIKTYLGPGETKEKREILTFDLNYFRPDVKSYEGLSLRAKRILVRPSWLRTEDEIKYIIQYTIRLPCFDRYTVEVRKKLARVLYYDKVEKGRIVVRQGDSGFYFYFIVTGKVLVEQLTTDSKTGKKVSMIVGELSPGQSFGEMAFLYGGRRKASIICYEDTEFLKVDKASFDEVLKPSHEDEWVIRVNLLRTNPLFEKWKDRNLTTAVQDSQTKDFPPNSVIIKDLSIPSKTVHFIIFGSCQVIRRVRLWEKVQNYHSDNFMFNKTPHTSECCLKNSNSMLNSCKMVGNSVYRLVTKWWVIRILKEGEYFGLGEGDETMSVICDQNVTVLLVNKNVFRKRGYDRELARLRAEAISWYPSNEEALESYLVWRRWNQYKKNVGLEVLGKRHARESKEDYLLAD